MKLSLIAPVLALALTACGASTPPPQPTPPSAAIVALAHPPGLQAPAPAKTRVLDHQHWSIEVPSDWLVKDDSEEGVIVRREKTELVKPAVLQVISQKLDGVPPEQFVMVMSIMAEKQLPEGVKSEGVQRKMGEYKGHMSSITEVVTDHGVFLGVFATVDEANDTGYAVVSIAPQTPADSKLMGTITQTFTLK